MTRDGRDSSRMSYVSEQEHSGLARPVSGPMKRLSRLTRSSLTWSNELWTDGPPSPRSIADGAFEREMLGGLDGRLAEKSRVLLRNRGHGMMRAGGEGRELGRGVEDVRLRQEHVERSVVQMPMLEGEVGGGGGGGAGAAGVGRGAVFCELRDLYVIMMSMEMRKYDLGVGDVRALFEWFVMFERFVRIYLWVSERWLFEGVGGAAERRREKRRIVEGLVRVEGMRRVMMGGCMKGLQELRGRVDDMSMKVVRYMNEEVAVLGGVEAGRVEEGLRNVMEEIRGMAGGKEVLGILGRGGGARWVRGVCGKWDARWLWGVVDRHSSYVRAFARAEKEYKEFYKALSRLVDEELRGIRERRAGGRVRGEDGQ